MDDEKEATSNNINKNLIEISKKFKNEVRIIYEASIMSNDIEKDKFLKIYENFKEILKEN